MFLKRFLFMAIIVIAIACEHCAYSWGTPAPARAYSWGAPAAPAPASAYSWGAPAAPAAAYDPSSDFAFNNPDGNMNEAYNRNALDNLLALELEDLESEDDSY